MAFWALVFLKSGAISVIDEPSTMWMGYAPQFPPFLALPSSFLPRLRSSHHRFRLCWLVGLGVALVFLLALARLVARVQWASLADRRVGTYVAAARGLVVGTCTRRHG